MEHGIAQLVLLFLIFPTCINLLHDYINLKHHLIFCPFELVEKLPKMSKSTIEQAIVPPDHPLQENIFLSNCSIESIYLFIWRRNHITNGLTYLYKRYFELGMSIKKLTILLYLLSCLTISH